MNFEKLFGIERFDYFIIFTTNRCNLHCERCITFCHEPLNPESEYEILRERYEISIEEVETFCRRFMGVGEENYVRLTGGEPTLIEKEKFGEIIEVLKSYNRKIWMITNGYGLLRIDENILKNIDRYTLDNHKINHFQVEKCLDYLKMLGITDIRVLETHVHYDCISARENPYNKKRNCGLFMVTPILYKGVVYPCCTNPFLEIYNKNRVMSHHLISAGWNLDNPWLLTRLRHWRVTVPKYVLDQCLNHCWRPQYKNYPSSEITLKDHDVIAWRGP